MTHSDGLPTVAHPLRSDRRDAAFWTIFSIVVLTITPIGFISGDGLAQSINYATGNWHWNPNHLFYEPLGAWWLHTFAPLFPRRFGLDVLKLLSVVAGAISLGIFRWGIARPIAGSRWGANIATIWVMAGATFLGLWLSDEAQMVQMPWLMLTGAATVRYVMAPSTKNSALIGFFAGCATLFYISNALVAAAVGIALCIWHVSRGERKEGISAFWVVGITSGLVCVVGFVTAWLLVAPHGIGLVSWLTTYGGGQGSERVAENYGIHSAHELITACMRAAFGTANVLVDVTPVLDRIRLGLATSPLRIGGIVLISLITWSAVLYTIVFALRKGARSANAQNAGQNAGEPSAQSARAATLLVFAAWSIGILVFAIWWNNSDDQFYFQLALPIATLIAFLSRQQSARRFLLVSTAALVLWNGWDALTSLIGYPRKAYLAALTEQTHDASLVLSPGQDEVGRLLYFVTRDTPRRRLEITAIATRAPAPQGMDELRNRIRSVVDSGGRVAVIEVFDVPLSQNPWKYLEDLGYSPPAILKLLQEFPHSCSSRHAGPFTVRIIANKEQCGQPTL